MTAGQIKAAPTSEAERIVILDSLRGIAVLGILLMNIPWFAFPRMVVESPNLVDFSGPNFYSWFAVEWFFEGTQRALFSTLFGAGMLLFISRLEDRTTGLMPAEYFVKRQLWLLLFGLFNAYVLLWPGDILFHYAILGLFIFAFRRLKPKHLLVAATACLVLQIARNNLDFYRDKQIISRGEAIARIDTTKTPLTAFQKDRLRQYEDFKKENTYESKKMAMERSIKTMQGDYAGVYKHQSEFAFRVETGGMFHFVFFDVLLFMFIGMALYKNGVLIGHAPVRTYWLLFLIGMSVGLVLSYLRLSTPLKYNFDGYAYTKNVAFDLYGLSRVFRALGIFGGIMLLYKSNAFKWFFALMRPVGQMAFTNYLAQSLLCAILFYGIGFGWYGKLQYHQMYYVVGAIWAAQIVWSHIWFRYYRFGPMEWLWRSLTYWKKQPFKRGARRVALTSQTEVVEV